MVTEFEPLPCGHPGIARPCPHCEIERLRAELETAQRKIEGLTSLVDRGDDMVESVTAKLVEARAALGDAQRDAFHAKTDAVVWAGACEERDGEIARLRAALCAEAAYEAESAQLRAALETARREAEKLRDSLMKSMPIMRTHKFPWELDRRVTGADKSEVR